MSTRTTVKSLEERLNTASRCMADTRKRAAEQDVRIAKLERLVEALRSGTLGTK